MSNTPEDGYDKNYRTYILFLLTAVYAFNFIDRQILGILSPLIKADLGLTDGQLGLLKGFVFALFYTMIGIPIAWLADRYNRVTIVAVSLGIWSAFTAFTGLANNYAQMFLARMGVGIGEAGGSPPSHSIISDLYGQENRASALGIYSLGIPFGLMTAFFTVAYLLSGGGMSWRGVMITLGIPGVLLAILLKLTVKEPKRGASDAAQNVEQLNFFDTVKLLMTIPSWWGMCIGIAFVSFGGYALSNWVIDFFDRAHPEFNMIHLFIISGVQNGLAYGVGTWLGGVMADKWARKNKKAYALVAAWSMAIGAPALILSFWTGNTVIVLILITIYLFMAGFYLAPSFFVAQTLAPISARAMSTALFFLILNIIALGGGPTYVGILSEMLTEAHGEVHSLRLAMTSLIFFYAIGIAAFFWTANRLPKDLEKANQLNNGSAG